MKQLSIGIFYTKLVQCLNISMKPVITLIIYLLLELQVTRARHSPSEFHQDSKQSVCYGHLGCFSKLSPFDPEMSLPSSPSKIQTKYYLRTRLNPLLDQSISPNPKNLTNSYFDSKKPTKLIIHGFRLFSSESAGWMPEITEAILQQEDVNVIQIDWATGAHDKYDNAVANTRVVGAQIGYLIGMLMEVHDAKAGDFHIIGFSLGAHVAGFAGKKVQENGKHTVGRITGLDPAGPGFDFDSPVVRLDKTDAKFVDVIHMDTNTIFSMSVGLNRNLGHIDFYPNGGADQEGCSGFACDHLRTPELYKNTINANDDQFHMIGFKCSSFEKFKQGACLRCYGPNGESNRCNRMGYWAKRPNTQKHIKYYLLTSAKAPFTVQHYQIHIHWRNKSFADPGGFKTKLFITLHGDKGSTQEINLNDGSTFHVYAGRTTRFLVSHDTRKNIGEVHSLTFRWERPTCWTYFFCPQENVVLKRIKVLDASEQQMSVFLPLGKNRNERIREHIIKPGEKFELLRTSYIRRQYPKRRYKALHKAEAKLKNYSEDVIVPPILSFENKKPFQTKPLIDSITEELTDEIIHNPNSRNDV